MKKLLLALCLLAFPAYAQDITQFSPTIFEGTEFAKSAGKIGLKAGGIADSKLAGSIAASKLVGTDIATLGTVTAGTWNAGVIAGQYGGTGVANTGKTITLDGNLTTSGAFATTLTATATTTLTLPTTGTLATLAGTEMLTNKTLSGGTLTDLTTLPSSGQLTAAGELGLLASPLGLLDLGGTYTSANASWIRAVGIVASSATTQTGFNLSPTFTPSGASLGTLTFAGLSGTIGTTALNITTLVANSSNFTLSAGYSGVVTNANLFIANAGTLNGATVTNLNQFNAIVLVNGNGATSGSVTNRQAWLQGITAGAAGGTINNRGLQLVVPSGGASSGTAVNRGIFITGNGGTASGGTVTNHAIYSDSTAMSLLTGGLTVGTTTLLTSSVALTNGAAAATGTLLNAPAAGNPTKWIPINDNGTTRYVPAW